MKKILLTALLFVSFAAPADAGILRALSRMAMAPITVPCNLVKGLFGLGEDYDEILLNQFLLYQTMVSQ